MTELLRSILSAQPVKLRWDLKPSDVLPLADALMERSKGAYDAVVAASSSGKLSWDSICAPLTRDDAEFSTVENILTFPSHVSPSREMRDAATEAEKKLSSFGVDAASRTDVYDAVKQFSETEEATELVGEKKRYLEKLMRDYRRRGMHLDDETRSKVKELNKKISQLGIEFQKNLGEENSSFIYTAKQLKGCPEAYLNQRKQPDGRYKVTLKYPCYIPLMERCSVEETRRDMETKFNSRCMESNTQILEELVELRDTKAKLMGYSTHSDFITEVRMAKSAAAVSSFLSELSEKLRPLLTRDIAEIVELKKRECGEGCDAQIHGWDRVYYSKKLAEEKFNVDHEKLREYFPLSVVKEGLLDIYQGLLGLTFEEDKSIGTWCDDVECYKVTDSNDETLIGWFFLDLYPRDGKYNHAACFGLQSACEVEEGKWQHPVAACVCNFTKPSEDRPSLLTHREVETFFHEFGHVTHQLLSKAKLQSFSGTRVERDFVEAPSQMLENWVWEEAAIRRMSKHYESGEPIPGDLMQALLNSRNASSGIFNMRQVVLASFDQSIHTSTKVDTAKELARLSSDLLKISVSPGTNMAASFGHLAGGYDASYYGYLYAEVFSADMFQMFKKDGLFSHSVGMLYRREILEAGGARDASDSLRAFLGRDPVPEPFLRAKGL
eukprot:g5036.t1